jgi:glycogen debranching enzyme
MRNDVTGYRSVRTVRRNLHSPVLLARSTLPSRAILDVLPSAPEHAREELLNDLGLQLASGFLPGLYWMNPAANAGLRPRFDPNNSHPPVWVVAADEYLTRTGDRTLTREFFDHARRQIEWVRNESKGDTWRLLVPRHPDEQVGERC